MSGGTKLVYHGTSFSRAQRILDEGIRPSAHNGYTAVAEQLRSAGVFAQVCARRDQDNFAVVFSVELPASSLTVPDRFGPLPRARDGKYWQYRDGVIPPSKIRPVAFYMLREHSEYAGDYARVQSPSVELELQSLLHRA